MLEHEILTVAVPDIPESLPESVEHRHCRARRAEIERQEYYPVRLSRLLRLGGDWRGEESEDDDEP